MIPLVFREEELGVFAVNRDKIALKVVPASTVLPVKENSMKASCFGKLFQSEIVTEC